MSKILKLDPNRNINKIYYELTIYVNLNNVHITNTITLIDCLALIPEKIQIDKSYVIFNRIYYKIFIYDLIAFNTLWEAILRQCLQPIFIKKIQERKKP